MPRTLPVFAAFVLLWVSAGAAGAQNRVPPVAARILPLGLEIHGTVVDELGERVQGASVMALGVTRAVARSDMAGRFSLSLPPGKYVLRATRDGYTSTYRESIDLATDASVTRRITLTRRGPVPPSPAPQLASTSMGPADPPLDGTATAPPGGMATADAPPSETAWRLRHLPRTILRDAASGFAAEVPEWSRETSADVPVVVARALSSAGAWLTKADLTGHVDVLTTGVLSAEGDEAARGWPRGVAYVVFGAPVGGRGDWSVRAAWTAGDAASWTLLGEYHASRGQAHALRTGVSYSAQMLTADAIEPLAHAFPGARRVGGAYLSDAWTIAPGVAVDYGLRVERYDYLAAPTLWSGTVGLRLPVAARTTVTARLTPSMVAPGADQFQPPATTGVWLPPERTFSALEPAGLLVPESVERYDLLLETRLRATEDAWRLRGGRFAEFVEDQIVTVFGLDRARGAAHYFITTSGDARLTGWTIGAAGALSRYVQAAVDYRAVRTQWGDETPATALTAAPSAQRAGSDFGHDLTASVDADVPGTSTRVNLSYRMNNGFSTPASPSPTAAGRFKIEVRQQLPFQPLNRGELNLLFSARTLLHELKEHSGYFDELLTVAPPLRVTCGLQMRF